MKDFYIGIDNGVTGAFAIIDTKNKNILFFSTPTFKCRDYTIKSANITRLNVPDLLKRLTPYKENATALIERPMINPGRFKASISASRALEATLVCLDMLCISYDYVDSKKWQKVFLPDGIKGDDLKVKSKEISIGKYPMYEKEITKQKDGDALFIAEYLKMKDN